PDPGQVFIGSSMPIRAADSFWPLARPKQRFFGNRGASGIDGLVSSGLGVATGRDPSPTVLLLGDLSLYHDMNGLWALQRHGIRATLVSVKTKAAGSFTSRRQGSIKTGSTRTSPPLLDWTWRRGGDFTGSCTARSQTAPGSSRRSPMPSQRRHPRWSSCASSARTVSAGSVSVGRRQPQP